MLVPDNDNTLSFKELLGNGTSQSADKMTTPINHYNSLEPHSYRGGMLHFVELDTEGVCNNLARIHAEKGLLNGAELNKKSFSKIWTGMYIDGIC